MSKTTIKPLTVTVVNPPVHIDLPPISVRSSMRSLSVSTEGETVTLDLKPIK